MNSERDGETSQEVVKNITIDVNVEAENVMAENVSREEPLSRGHRVKQPSIRLREYMTNTITASPHVHSSL